MKIGIVGLPNVGKSTLFNALTKSYGADSANFPFCTIEPNVGIVDVKDERLEKLAEISNTQKIIYANTNFIDIAGIVKWASDGEWLGNKFLSHIREVDTIVQVVRHFQDDDVVHVEWWPDPLRDVEIINMELIIADIQMIDNILWPLQRKLKSRDPEAILLCDVLERLKTHLGDGHLAVDFDFNAKETEALKPYNFLTTKPFLYALNVTETDLKNAETLRTEYESKLGKKVAIVSAKFETEIMEMDEEDREMFVEDLKDGTDVRIPTLDDLIKMAYDTLWLMYYFTTGEKESRAWTIRKWYTAPQWAGVIHTDFERGFIKAEIVTYEDFVSTWWRSGAKEKGKLRLEGKEYIMQDGDVVTFRFNV